MPNFSVLALQRHIRSLLQPALNNEAEAATRALICDTLHWTLTDLALHQQDTLPQDTSSNLISLAQRLAHHEPLQYVTGHTDFCGININTSPAALIPRPETEQLVSLLTQWADNRPNLRILDVGTGSGCIPQALSSLLNSPSILAVDISTDALNLARTNTQSPPVTLRQLDILSATPDNLPTFDAIISNPPYVMLSEQPSIAPNVLNYEPHLALFVPDSDPLIFYRQIATLALHGTLKPHGQLFFEINEALATQTLNLLHSLHFNPTLHHDYLDKPRFITASPIPQ